MTPIRFSIPAAVAVKALVGGAVVALAAAGAATTHSANPAAWGQHVSEAVEQCKAAGGNVGRCVSAIAQEHGEQMRLQHSEAVENGKSPEPGQREGQESDKSKGGNGAAASSGHAQGHATTPPTPAAAAHGQGHGKPSPSPSSDG